MLANEILDILNQTAFQTPARTPSPNLDKNAFLLLLVKQLSVQDPLEPMTNQEFVSQLAQFGSLEQAINLNTAFGQFMGLQQLTQGSTLLGRKVICLVRTTEGVAPVSGTVEQVMLIQGTAYLRLSTGDEVPLESVVSVEPGGDA